MDQQSRVDAMLELDLLRMQLPPIKTPYAICEKCGWISWKNRFVKCPECKANMILMGTSRKVTMQDLDKISKKLRKQAEPILRRIAELKERLNE